jgi:hypothetical protein
MKNIMKVFFSVALLTIAIASCKKEETKIFLESSTAPVLIQADGDSVLVLSLPNKNVHAATLSWTNPEFRFTTGVNSQDITYTLQMDTTGGHFATQALDLTSVNNYLVMDITQGELNTWILPTKLRYDVAHYIELRLKATVNGSAASVYSNIIPLKVTPYLDVAVPIPTDGALWALGNAFASNWDNPMKDPFTANQKFTKVSETLYELTVHFIGGGNFKFIQKQGDWDLQYRPKYDANVPFAEGNFERKNADPGWNGPAAPGDYKITLDFVTGKYKIEKV